MSAELSIESILYLLGAGQGAFLSIALFSCKRCNSRANIYLGLLTLLFSLTLIDFFLDSDTVKGGDTLRILLWPRDYLYGVLLYFYTRELTQAGKYLLQGKQWLHVLPVALHVLLAWSLFFIDETRQSAIFKDEVNTGGLDGVYAWLLGDFELFSSIIHFTVYLLLSLRLLTLHSQRIKKTFSYNEKISLNWLRVLLLSLLLIFSIWMIEEFLSEWLELEAFFSSLLGISMVVLVYLMGYLGLRQPEIFSHHSEVLDSDVVDQVNTDNDVITASTQTTNSVKETTDKYKNSPLSNDQSELLLKELHAHMQREKPYLDSKLSLPQLADQLDISANYLSQIINQQQGKNFFDYINGFRIDEAKFRFSHPQRENENILTVAMDVGFNSKSSFYTAFKKHTELTPGQYRKTLTISSVQN